MSESKNNAIITINYNGIKYCYNLKNEYRSVFSGDEKISGTKMSLEEMKLEVLKITNAVFNIEFNSIVEVKDEKID